MIGKIPIPAPIPFTIGISINLSPAFCILPFPVYDGKYGNLPDSRLNHTGFLKLLFGSIFPSEINYEYFASNFPYRCEKELVTVAAGTYDTCKVSAGTFELQIENNYAPEVGNIVKQRIWECKWAFPNDPYIEIKQELLSTTYTPDR
jgi:hypothetical protein